MTKTDRTMIERVDDRLGMLWFQMDQVGHEGFRREIEEVAERFMFPGDTPTGARDIEQAHDLFQRVHARYTEEIQRRWGQRLVRCPHCPEKEGAR